MSTPLGQQLRADAAWVLFQILEKGMSSKQALGQRLPDYEGRDRAWLQEMVFGCLRTLPILQFWLRGLLDKPLKGRKKILEHLILLGLYQLAYSRVSEHAAVSETVGAADLLKGTTLKALINAILRTFIRENVGETLPDSLAAQAGMPNWIYKSIQANYPEQASDILQVSNEKAPLWLRINQANISTAEFLAKLEEMQIEAQLSAIHPDAVMCTRSGDVTRFPGYDEGWFSVQDGAAQLAAHLLDLQPHQRVLDCCAAPGGKTAHILATQPDLKECVAIDSDAHRLVRVEENLARLNHHATLICAEAQEVEGWHNGELFDRILLDAPCSATGVIRRHPDIRWLRQASDIAPLVAIQAQLLQQMWQILKPGGKLLYATCSIFPEENAQQIQAFIEQHPEAEIIALPPELHSVSTATNAIGLQILPGNGNMDGFYYALLHKPAQS